MHNHGIGLDSDQICEDIVIPKITQITNNLFDRSFQISQKIWNIIEKRPYWVSVVHDRHHMIVTVQFSNLILV